MGIMPFLIIYMHLTLVGINAYEASFVFPPAAAGALTTAGFAGGE